MHLDELAVSRTLIAPLQSTDGLVGSLCLAVIDETIALERAVKNLAGTVDMDHQLFGGVPRVHQHHAKRQLLARHGIVEHLLNVLELGLLVSLRGEDAPVDDPVATALGVDVQAVDHADALDQSVGIAAVLPTHQLDGMGVVLVRDAVVEQQECVRIIFNGFLDLFPDDGRRYIVVLQIAVDGIMRKVRMVVGEVGLGVVGLSGNQKLTVVASCRLHHDFLVD